MHKVVWSDAALDQIDVITDYIEQCNPKASVDIARRLRDLGESLRDFPRRGRPAAGGSREMVTVRPFILRYSVKQDIVLILHVRHSAQQSLDDGA